MESSKEIQMEPGSSSPMQMDEGSSSAMQIDPEIANFESRIHYGFNPRFHFMSLSYVIQTRYQNGLPEEFIAIIMQDVLRALVYLLVYKTFEHRDLNSREVFICRNSNSVDIRILASPLLKHGRPRPRFTSTKGLWRLGIIALEMAYGSSILAYNSSILAYNFNRAWSLIVNNVATVLKLILANPDEEGEETAQKELESAKNQTSKEGAMQIGTRTLKIADDLELKEKAKQKGKEPMKISDDPKGKGKTIEKGKEELGLEDDPAGKTMAEEKEKAIEKGKEKLGLEDDPAGKTMAEEKRKEMAKRKGKKQKKLIIKLPPFKNLRNPLYVDQLVDKYNRGKEKQEKKNGNAELKEKLKTVLIFICCQRFKEAKTKFSRDFLEVVLMCFDKSRNATAKEILEHSFFHQRLNVGEFERTMRSIPPQIWAPSEAIP